MEENSKDQILMDFQNITAIDDVGEAFARLEDCNWDLMAAIQRVMPQEPSPMEPMDTKSNDLSSNNSDYQWNISENPSLNRASSSLGLINNDFMSGPSTSSNSHGNNLNSDRKILNDEMKRINFNIHFNEDIFYIKLFSKSTIADLKENIFNRTKVPICRQAIRGWPPAKLEDAQLPTTKLEALDLSNENELILIDINNESYMNDDDEAVRRISETFKLNITVEADMETNNKMSLFFPGNRTILDVKTDVYAVTDIPVRHQEWTGWPISSDNSTTLAQSGIELEHSLVLRSSAADNNKYNIRPSKSNNIANADSDSSEEFEDASDFNNDDELFSDSPAQPRLKHLIPNGTDDEAMGSFHFVENYIQRYGEPHPLFFQGSLEDALKEACHKPAKNRKLLAIYLHHDNSVLTNVFCDQLLRCESVMQTLCQNFILYGWDLTYESNKNLFLSSISACVGVTASITVRNIPEDRLPALIIIAKTRSTCEVLSVIHGNVGVDDLLTRLMETVEMYSEHVRVEVREENDRAAREQMKYEQDLAYQQTLEADMAKEAAKKQKEMSLAAERQRLESEKAEQEARKESIRLDAERAVPPEPDVNVTENVTKIRVRKPTGEFLERRFFGDCSLQSLLNFITSQGFLIDEYKVISSWPRRDLSTINPNETLKNLKLFPQETVTLEER